MFDPSKSDYLTNQSLGDNNRCGKRYYSTNWGSALEMKACAWKTVINCGPPGAEKYNPTE